MARPRKQGMDYFPFDVTFFTDKKIRRLRSRYGNDGCAVYMYLLCAVYSDKGYYTEMDEDLKLDICDELDLETDRAEEIISWMLSRGLFDETIAKKYGILTSRGIQLRFQEVRRSKRQKILVRKELWILDPEETAGNITTDPSELEQEESFDGKNPGFDGNNMGFDGKNPSFDGKNPLKERKENKSKRNKKKAKETKEDESKAQPSRQAPEKGELSDREREELVGMSSVGSVEAYILKIRSWEKRTGKKVADLYTTIRSWIIRDKERGILKLPSREEDSLDLDEVERFAMNFTITDDDEGDDVGELSEAGEDLPDDPDDLGLPEEGYPPELL